MALPRKLTAKIHEIKAHVGKVTSLDLGETGRVLVTGGQDRNVNLWAIGEEKCFMSLTGHNGTIDCVKFAYNDDFVYSADDIGIIRRWDLNAQTICSTLNGHMKSVRTLDFNPSGEYVVSGSNDTTVRLWDVRNHNKCIKTYRGHIANVNSVKFSPDGLWIASAGTEGSVIIWDIRKSKQIIQFTERASPITCIQFHPFEFLLAVGRNDGSVYIYDLESNQLISKTDSTCNFNGHTVKCITFSDNGECLFVGTAQGISVIGWEPDREFDNIESTWSILGDMKIVNKKLICGSYEREYVSIHALSIDRVFPFYNPSNAPFSHNQTTRKSFSRGNQKLRLSIGGAKPSRVIEESDEKSPSLDGQSSPNLSIELVEEIDPSVALSNGLPLDNYNPKKISSYNFPSISSNTSYASSNSGIEGPSSLKLPGERDIYKFNRIVESYTSEIDSYNLNDSNPPIISNYIEPESEDFHVNNAQPPDYAPKLDTTGFNNHSSNFKTPKLKSNVQVQKKTMVTKTTGFQNRKLSQVTSISTNDLHKLDETLVPTVTKKFNATNNRFKRDNNNVNKENNKNKNIPVQIMTKPTRSRTSFDLRSSEKRTITSSQQTHQQITSVTNESYQQMTKNITSDLITPSYKSTNHNNFDETADIQMLTTYHQQVYQELSNRHATLQIIRNSTKSQDIVGALNQAIKIKSRTVFVDILGATLEKTSSWNLDLCLILLPEIFELLQSQHKFHYTRACDTLRVILSNFLPIIQENIDPWSACSLGVDVTREERQHKCIECQHWLIKIRNITDSQHVGSALTQLQNLIKFKIEDKNIVKKGRKTGVIKE